MILNKKKFIGDFICDFVVIINFLYINLMNYLVIFYSVRIVQSTGLIC